MYNLDKGILQSLDCMLNRFYEVPVV